MAHELNPSTPGVATLWLANSAARIEGAIALAAAAALAVGASTGQPALLGAGGIGLTLALRNAWTLRGDPPARRSGAEPPRNPREQPPADPHPPARRPPAPPAASPADLVDAMIVAGRYALLLRPETAEHLTRGQATRAVEALDTHMVVTPAGGVLLGMDAERVTLGLDVAEGPVENRRDAVVQVEAFYLDRYCVTNAEYHAFVAAGGYEELEFWSDEALPALFDFVDSTGSPGPKHWAYGAPPPGEGKRPVVGISWFEATAYARWVGKRLPTDAEWTKACAWPIETAPGRLSQRRYPWGEAFDPKRANLWCSGVGSTVQVDALPAGATVGGVEQMVGNVWEWTASHLNDSLPPGVRYPDTLRSIRGGAYNTYFENQATCHFQSAEHPLARRANVGFRLALSMSCLASSNAAPPPDASA